MGNIEVVRKRCECGIIVAGMTKAIMEMNMVVHKLGIKHKKAMEIKQFHAKEKENKQ